MSTFDENGFVSDAQFNKSFKIPKKRPLDTTEESTLTETVEVENVLAHSYHNLQQPIEAVVQGPVADEMTQTIYSTLIEQQEKPKTYRNNVFHETVPDVNDTSLPKELTLQFQPLFCKLCNAQLSSNVMAKLHYKSKNHEKKIRKYLLDYAERTGEPLHKRAKVTAAKPTEEEQDPKYYHCEVCDLALTGKMHAESHYMGRNHQKAIMGLKNPSGRGFYNADGKWVRAKTETPPEPKKEAKEPSTTRFHCDLCGVSATCQQQLDMHIQGQKHGKKMRLMGVRPDDVQVTEDMLAVYRTPSGCFYCQTCNLNLNSESQFRAHLGSKNHKKKIQQPQVK